MKKLIATMITTASLAAVGIAVAPAANAVNCNAFNQGTGTAAHVRGVSSPGILMIADACHPS